MILRGAIVVLIVWTIALSAFVLYVLLSGGWYTYRPAPRFPSTGGVDQLTLDRMIEHERCEDITGPRTQILLRCPRFRLP